MTELKTNSNWVLETDRLAFRPFVLEDLPLLIEQRSDPEMNRYLGGPDLQNAAFLSKRINYYISSFESCGFGSCLMFWKKTGEPIGSAGLQPLEGTDDIEVGYNMINEFWGRGIGTEAAKAWMDYGFKKGLERIVAVAHLDNLASIRIMKKLGMTYEKTEMHWGIECDFYGISKNEFYRSNVI